MVLKDAHSIVKLYALVNVENYSIVATGATQEEVMAEYRALLVQNGVIEPSEEKIPEAEGAKDVNVTVTDVRIVTVDGNSVLYLTAEDGIVYKGAFRNDETLILIREGDHVSLTVLPTENERIFTIVKWSEASIDDRTE